MNKPIIKYCVYILASATILLLAGCSLWMPTAAPTSQPQPTSTAPPIITPKSQLPTTIPSYIHYTPPVGYYIHLEFDYPASWIFRQGPFAAFSLLDPRFQTLPTPASGDLHPTPNDFGVIAVRIEPSKPGQTPDTELEVYKQDYKDALRHTVLTDYKITIGGQDASVLEYKVEPAPDDYPAVIFSRRTFFIVEDQLYEIYFSIAEKDRGGDFEKGYEYFLNSLRIVP